MTKQGFTEIWFAVVALQVVVFVLLVRTRFGRFVSIPFFWLRGLTLESIERTKKELCGNAHYCVVYRSREGSVVVLIRKIRYQNAFLPFIIFGRSTITFVTPGWPIVFFVASVMCLSDGPRYLGLLILLVWTVGCFVGAAFEARRIAPRPDKP